MAPRCLTHEDLCAIDNALIALYTSRACLDAFPKHVLDVLTGFVSADNWCYSERDLTSQAVRSLMTVPPPNPEEVCARFLQIKDQYPIYHYDPRTHTRSLLYSDFMSPAAFHETELYRDVLRRCGIEWALISYDRCEGIVIGFAALRGYPRNFEERERARMDVLRPHISRAYEISRLYTLLKGQAPSPQDLQQLKLTWREAEVLHWVVVGKSNVEVAMILGTAVQTIKSHLRAIFIKLRVENRSAAILAALRFSRGHTPPQAGSRTDNEPR
jgi:DNA-binding CsgD family transcriptional regulator